MTPIRFAGVVLLLTVLSACGNLAMYSVDEATVQNYLNREIQQLDHQWLAQNGIGELDIERARVTLGPDGRDVVLVDFSGSAKVNALFAQIPVGLNFAVEGAPVYEGADKAVYVRNLNLVSGELQSSFGNVNFGDYGAVITNLAAQFLDNHPVYRLDETQAAQRLLGMTNLSIRVAPGRLELVPGN